MTARDAEHAATKLAGILASREAQRAAAGAAKGGERGAKQATATGAAATPAAKVVTLKGRPVLRLPAFVESADERQHSSDGVGGVTHEAGALVHAGAAKPPLGDVYTLPGGGSRCR